MLTLLKGSYDAILKIIILCIWCNRKCWHALMFKKHYFSNTVHYCSFSMPRLSQTRHFLQSPSFQQVQSALIGQLTQCIVIGRTPQARVGNVTPLTIIASFSFQVSFISSSRRGEQSRVTDTVMMLVCICSKQAAVKMISDGLYTPLWCDPGPLTHTRCFMRKTPHLNSQ